MIQIQVRFPDGSGKRFRLDGDRVLVGSGPEADVRLPGPGVASRHATLERGDDGSVLLRDLDSDTGTRVNGGWISLRRLRDGDRIEIGDCELLVLLREAASGGGSARAERTPPRPHPAAGGPQRPARSAESVGEAAAERPRRRRRTGTARSLLWAAAALALLAGLFKVLPGGPEHTFDRVAAQRARIHAWTEAGELDRALAVVHEMERGDAEERAAAEEERRAIDAWKARAKMAERELAETRRVPASERAERLRLLLDAYGDLPRVRDRIADALRDALVVLYEERLPRAAEVIERERASDEALARGDYASARRAWKAMAASSLATDAYLVASETGAVDAAAERAADRLLTRVDDLLARGDPLAAAIELDEEELRAFRGTSAFTRLDRRAEEVDLTLARGARPPLPGEEAGAAVEPPDGEEEASGGRRPAPSFAASGDVEALIESGDAAFAMRRFEEALSIYQRALDGRPRFRDRERIVRRVERAQRAVWFLEGLLAAVEEDPERFSATALRRGDGAPVGRVVGVREGRFETDAGVEVGPAELDPDVVHRLSDRRARRTAEDRLNEACFALSHGARALADRRLVEALSDPALEGAVHRMVCFLRGMEEMPEWGFFRVDGEWLTFREKERRAQEARLAAAEKRLGERDDEAFRAALDELRDVAAVLHDEVLEVLRADRRARLEVLREAKEGVALEGLRQKRLELEQRRRDALEKIFDREWYFYPYTVPAVSSDKASLYPERQQEVDRLVARVRELWGDEFGEAPGGVRLSPAFRRALSRLRLEEELLGGLDPDFHLEEEARRWRLLPTDVDRVTVRNLALDAEERERLDHDREILAANAQAETVATAAERQQVWITNRYRLMMGRGALRLNDKLVRAARAHCDWMSRSGKFSHFNDEDPKLRTPALRIAAQGYTAGGAGENIAIAGGARAAHDGWIHSSGHHRNILFPSHREVGVGNAGRYWCQDFAGGAEYTGNLIDPDH